MRCTINEFSTYMYPGGSGVVTLSRKNFCCLIFVVSLYIYIYTVRYGHGIGRELKDRKKMGVSLGVSLEALILSKEKL